MLFLAASLSLGIKKCGGLVVENTTHYINILRWLIESPVTKVYANLAKLLPDDRTVEDRGVIILHFEKPVIAIIAHGANAPEDFPDEDLKLIGTKGSF
jgi:predicted dehydrogenase